MSGHAASGRSRWGTCATTTTTSAPSGEPAKRTSSGAASKPASATARWPTPPTPTCSRTRRRSRRWRQRSPARGSQEGRFPLQAEDRVLVTGATGFLASHLIPALHQRGYAVRALVLPSEDATWLRERGVAVYPGDVRQPG